MQPQKIAKILKLLIYKGEVLYYLWSENKTASRSAALFFAYANHWISDAVADVKNGLSNFCSDMLVLNLFKTILHRIVVN